MLSLDPASGASTAPRLPVMLTGPANTLLRLALGLALLPRRRDCVESGAPRSGPGATARALRLVPASGTRDRDRLRWRVLPSLASASGLDAPSGRLVRVRRRATVCVLRRL